MPARAAGAYRGKDQQIFLSADAAALRATKDRPRGCRCQARISSRVIGMQLQPMRIRLE
jgi:hypothetical protein